MQQDLLTSEFIITFCIFALAVAGAAIMVLLERKPKDSLAPRLLPTTPVMLICGFAALIALVHLVNLAGVHTGR